jgi:hypothetical protein
MDPTHITQTQAALYAAIVGGSAALVAAIIKGIGDAYIDGRKARREYRLKLLQPVLDHVGARVAGLDAFAPFLGYGGANLTPESTAALSSATKEFEDISSLGLIESDPALREAWREFDTAMNLCAMQIGKAGGAVSAGNAQMSDLRVDYAKVVDLARQTGVDFRKAVEGYLFLGWRRHF